MELKDNKRLTDDQLDKMADEAIGKIDMSLNYNKNVVAAFEADALKDIKTSRAIVYLYHTNISVPFDVAARMVKKFLDKKYYVWKWQTYSNAIYYFVTDRCLRPDTKYQQVIS